MFKLKQNQRLVPAGTTALRAPDGTLLPAVPQYTIVPADEADGNAPVQLPKGNVLIMVGSVCSDRKASEERYAALLEGRRAPPVKVSPLYISVRADEVSEDSGLHISEERVLSPLVRELFETFEAQMNELAAAERARRLGEQTRREIMKEFGKEDDNEEDNA